jgi:hypothetical protein
MERQARALRSGAARNRRLLLQRKVRTALVVQQGLENAHGTEFRELLYAWHPWFGLRVSVHQAIDRPEGLTFRCSLRGSDADRWREVPAWMFDRAACAKVRVSNDAHVGLAAIVTLTALLRLAPPNVPLSGAPGLSHDQNRGDAHATAEAATVRATAAGARGP